MRKALFLFGLTALSGCATYQPRPLLPDLSLDRLEQRTLADIDLRRFVATKLGREPISWDLEALTLVAFHLHPDLELARARWAVTEANAVTAGQRPNPSLSVTPAYNASSAIPTPWIVSASLEIPIETANKRAERSMVAEQLSLSAKLGIAAVAWDVRARVRRSLLELWAADATGKALAEQSEAHRDIVRLLESSQAAGEALLAETTRGRIALQRAQVASLDAQSRLEIARVQLATAVGLPLNALTDAEITFDAFIRRPEKLPPTEARRRAMLNRPDILASLADYAASDATLRLEIARQYPDLRLGPGYNYSQGDHEWKLGLGFELPLLNQNQGPIAAAEARRLEQHAKFATLQARVRGEVDIALVGYANACAKLDAATAILSQTAHQRRLAESMYAGGEISRLVLAASRVVAASATLSAIESRLRAQEALGQLENALQIPSATDASTALSAK